MYKKIEKVLRMSTNEASEKYPDSFLLMRMDSRDLSNDTGTILYIGDDSDELFSIAVRMKNNFNCGVIDGLYHMNSMGGIILDGKIIHPCS